MAVARVPPELWLQIIRDASYVPPNHISDYDPLPPNGSYHVLSGKLILLIRESLSTKYAISLVCKMWNAIVVEVLYEFIIVREAVHIPLLVDNLSRAGGRISRKVQRIDFMCVATTREVYYNEAPYNAKQLAYAAAKLIRLCPRLRALSSPASLWERDDTMTQKCYSRLLAAALMKVKDTLECIEWRSRWGLQSMMTLSRVILPRLQLLLFTSERLYHYASFVKDSHWDDILVTDNSEDDDDETQAEYPEDRPAIMTWTCSPLHTVDGEYFWNWTPSSQYERIPERLSSVKHFVIASDPYRFQLQNFWDLLPQIDTITFHQGGFHFVGYEGFNLPSTIHTIILHARDLPTTPPNFPHIKRVGLMGTEDLTTEEYDNAFKLLVGEDGEDDHFPVLDMIRLVDTSFSGIRRKRQFMVWERRCRSKGVRLEDETGVEVNDY